MPRTAHAAHTRTRQAVGGGEVRCAGRADKGQVGADTIAKARKREKQEGTELVSWLRIPGGSGAAVLWAIQDDSQRQSQEPTNISFESLPGAQSANPCGPLRAFRAFAFSRLCRSPGRRQRPPRARRPPAQGAFRPFVFSCALSSPRILEPGPRQRPQTNRQGGRRTDCPAVS